MTDELTSPRETLCARRQAGVSNIKRDVGYARAVQVFLARAT